MAHFRRFVIASSLLLCGLSSTFCQTGEGDTGVVRRTFRVFSLDRSEPNGMHYASTNQAPVELEFHRHERSIDYAYEGPPGMTFFRLVPGNDGTMTREPIAQVEIPANEDEVLILFLPTASLLDRERPAPSLEYSTLWLDDSESGFPYGTMRVVNACGAQLVGQVGDERLALPYSITEPYAIDRLDVNNNSWVPFAFAIETPAGYEIVYRNELQFDADRRSLMVLRPPRRPRSLRIETYLLEQSNVPPADLAEATTPESP